MMNNFFKDGTHVIVHSLGENTPGEFRAIVRGNALMGLYILEMIDRINSFEDYPYNHIIMTPACVKEA